MLTVLFCSPIHLFHELHQGQIAFYEKKGKNVPTLVKLPQLTDYRCNVAMLSDLTKKICKHLIGNGKLWEIHHCADFLVFLFFRFVLHLSISVEVHSLLLAQTALSFSAMGLNAFVLVLHHNLLDTNMINFRYNGAAKKKFDGYISISVGHMTLTLTL